MKVNLNASVSLFVPSSSLVAPLKLDAPKLESRRARKRLRTWELFTFEFTFRCEPNSYSEHQSEDEHEYGDVMVMMRWRRGNMCLHELRGSVVDWSMNSDEYRATGLELGYEYGDGYESEMFCCLSLTTRLPMTTVARKKGTQTFEATHLHTNQFCAKISIFSKYCANL